LPGLGQIPVPHAGRRNSKSTIGLQMAVEHFIVNVYDAAVILESQV